MNVTSITYAPVKGLGLVHVDEVELELTGVRENRRFHLIDDDGRLINGKFAGTLVQVAATADRDGASLSLRFPDGSVEDGPVTLGERRRDQFLRPPRRRAARQRRLRGGAVAARRAVRSGSCASTSPAPDPIAGSTARVSAVSRGSLEAIAHEAGRGERRRPPLPDAVRGRRNRAARRGRAGRGAGWRSATRSCGSTGSSAGAP